MAFVKTGDEGSIMGMACGRGVSLIDINTLEHRHIHTLSSDVYSLALFGPEMVAAGTDDKRIHFLHLEAGAWKSVSDYPLQKRVAAIIAAPDRKSFITGDKFGDAYQYNIVREGEGAEEKVVVNDGILLGGTVGMILDLALSHDKKYLLTCERYCKLRVSHYPRPWNIHSFCLGHDEFLFCLAMPPQHPHLAVTGSGDGTLRLWEFLEGKLLDTNVVTLPVPLSEEAKRRNFVKPHAPAVRHLTVSPVTGILAAGVDMEKKIRFFRIEDSKLVAAGEHELGAVVTSLTYDKNGCLWVCTLGEGKARLTVMRPEGPDGASVAATDEATLEKLKKIDDFLAAQNPVFANLISYYAEEGHEGSMTYFTRKERRKIAKKQRQKEVAEKQELLQQKRAKFLEEQEQEKQMQQQQQQQQQEPEKMQTE